MAALPSPGTTWADEVQAQDEETFPPRTETIEKDGTITAVEYGVNNEGKKIKSTRKIKRTVVKRSVNRQVTERMTWSKFGADKGKPAGPDPATTIVEQEVRLHLVPGNLKTQKEHEAAEADKAVRSQLANKQITCRKCHQGHYTMSCPLGSEIILEEDLTSSLFSESMPASGATTPSGRYIPPSQRPGALRSRDSLSSSLNDIPTLRITNLDEDTKEEDLRNIFDRFGRLTKVYVGKDKKTGLCAGFAFVSFESRAAAEKARAKVDGLLYEHQVLSCTWREPKIDGGARPRPLGMSQEEAAKLTRLERVSRFQR